MAQTEPGLARNFFMLTNARLWTIKLRCVTQGGRSECQNLRIHNNKIKPD